MTKYFVLTTPTCVKCKVIKSITDDRNLPIEFVFASSEEGKALRQEFKVMGAGIIVDRETGNTIDINDILR